MKITIPGEKKSYAKSSILVERDILAWKKPPSDSIMKLLKVNNYL